MKSSLMVKSTFLSGETAKLNFTMFKERDPMLAFAAHYNLKTFLFTVKRTGSALQSLPQGTLP